MDAGGHPNFLRRSEKLDSHGIDILRDLVSHFFEISCDASDICFEVQINIEHILALTRLFLKC